MKKKDVIRKLEKEYEKGKLRQYPNPQKDSGYMRGISRAIEIIKNTK